MEIFELYREAGENRSNLIAVNRFFINFVSIDALIDLCMYYSKKTFV